MITKYNKTFVKKDGSERVMNFVRLTELSIEDYNTLCIPPPSSTPSAKRKYGEGMEVVYDLDANDFRCFNWNAVKEQFSNNRNKEPSCLSTFPLIGLVYEGQEGFLLLGVNETNKLKD